VSKYLIFKQIERKNRKTLLIEVISKIHEFNLGKIKWYGMWRQYCFHPEQNTVFNSQCLMDIIAYVSELNLNHIKKLKDESE